VPKDVLDKDALDQIEKELAFFKLKMSKLHFYVMTDINSD